MLTIRTRASLVQLLQAIAPDSVRLLFLKHFGEDVWPIDSGRLLEATASAGPEPMAGLLIELVSGNTAIRADAPTKYVFDGRLADLRGRLRADGFEVIEDALVRLLPGAEPVAHIADALEEALTGSQLDIDGEIRRLLRESHDDISTVPPDCNGATTKARIALETVARRSAKAIAQRESKVAPADGWGSALAFLRSEGVVAQAEEEALAKVYTLISPGAHVPKGLTDEQWALLARTFAVSSAYFLTHQCLAA
jgi:hypothetical protein